MLGVALADNASHAVSLHDFAVLTNRLYARANFHGRSKKRRTTSCVEKDVSRQTLTVNRTVTSIKGKTPPPNRAADSTPAEPDQSTARGPSRSSARG